MKKLEKYTIKLHSVANQHWNNRNTYRIVQVNQIYIEDRGNHWVGKDHPIYSEIMLELNIITLIFHYLHTYIYLSIQFYIYLSIYMIISIILLLRMCSQMSILLLSCSTLCCWMRSSMFRSSLFLECLLAALVIFCWRCLASLVLRKMGVISITRSLSNYLIFSLDLCIIVSLSSPSLQLTYFLESLMDLWIMIFLPFYVLE